MLPDLVKTYEKNSFIPIKQVTTLQTLCDLMCDMHSSRTFLNDVSHLLQIAMTIPVSSATAERSFSALRRLKTIFYLLTVTALFTI